MYWQKHYITRWWCTDVLCFAAIFLAVSFVLATVARMGTAPDAHPINVADNRCEKVNEKCDNSVSTNWLLSAILRPYGEKAALPAISNQELQDTFVLQEAGHWKVADMNLKKVADTHPLRGYLLAQRYLHKDYTSTAAELKDWMAQYSDHPQAMTIYALAKQKGATEVETPVNSKQLRGSGYTQSSIRGQYAEWNNGIAAWKKRDYGRAYGNFVALAEHNDTQLKHWDRAAGHFWAYRAATRLGDKSSASRHLRLAAQHQGSFYGMQATFTMGKELEIEPVHYSDDTVIGLVGDFAPAKRAYALIKAEQFGLAAEEIRHAYYRADENQKYALLALAQKLNMPSMQIRLASQLHYRRNHELLNAALYPTPGWEPQQGYAVDPALVFAIARQESGFDDTVRSHAGAEGVMQIMPQTANYIIKRIDPDLHQKMVKESSPRLLRNLAMGQSYVRYLLEKPYINNNLVYLAIAYNAGAANLLEWKKNYDQTDPLLFVESLPYKETRDYIQNVLTNFWIYQEIMGNPQPQEPMLSATQWPIYSYNKQQLARANAFISRKLATLNTL